MVLVAPDPVGREQRGAAPGRCPKGELLAALRGHPQPRRFDPCLAGGLRAWLEDAAFGVAAARGEDTSPLYVGPRHVLGSPEGAPREALSTERVISRLVRALFRQLVTVGTVGDPLTDALDALRADGGADGVVGHVESLSCVPRAVLAEAVRAHAAHLRDLVPRFAPSWMPRTDDRLAIPLAGGRILLSGAIDLLVGAGPGHEAPLCAIALATDGPWEAKRRSLHYLALLETLRRGAPPIRVALLESATGRYGVEDVREEHMCAVAAHVAAWLGEEADAHG